MQRRRAVNLNSKCFCFFPCSLYVAVSAYVYFAIRRSFACGEGALAATTAAASISRCSFSVISVLTVVVMVCVLCCLCCVMLALFVAAILLL